MASDKLADFIPEGGDTSAYTVDGFQDFVPDPNPPVPTPPPTVTPEEVAKVEADVAVVQEEVQALQDEVTPPVAEIPQPVVEPVVVPETPAVTIEVPATELPVAPGDPVLVMSEDNTVAQATVADVPEQPSEITNPSLTPVEVDPTLDAQNDAVNPDQAPEPPVLETKPVVDPELAQLQADHAEPTMDEVIANAETPLEPLPDLEPLPEDN